MRSSCCFVSFMSRGIRLLGETRSIHRCSVYPKARRSAGALVDPVIAIWHEGFYHKVDLEVNSPFVVLWPQGPSWYQLREPAACSPLDFEASHAQLERIGIPTKRFATPREPNLLLSNTSWSKLGAGREWGF